MEFLKPRAKQEMSIDEVLYHKDRHLISDFAYKEFTHLSPDLPSLKRVKKRAVELNSNFHIHYLSNSKGVYETLEGKLNWLISQLMVKEELLGKNLLPNHIKVKVSGDGTCIGKRYHVVNMTCSLLLADGNLSGNHVLYIYLKFKKSMSLLSVLSIAL